MYPNRTDLPNGTRVSFDAIPGIHQGGTGIVQGGHPGEPTTWVSVLCDFDVAKGQQGGSGGRYMAISKLTPIER